MKKLTIKALLVALPLAAMISMAAQAETVALDKAPEAVKAAVTAAAGTEVKELEVATAGDKTTYTAKFTVAGAEKTVVFDAEGKEVPAAPAAPVEAPAAK
jgi:uncharacterized protein YfiM (DUF2279 family)